MDAELAAYGAGFDLIERMLDSLISGIFPQTAPGELLAAHEAAAGLPPRPDADDASRLELILLRRCRPVSGSLAGIEDALRGCGLISPVLTWENGVLRLSAAGVADGLDAGTAVELALRLLPAHVSAVIGQSWDDLDSLRHDWDYLDGQNLSWNELALGGV